MNTYYAQLIQAPSGKRSSALAGTLPKIVEYFTNELDELEQNDMLVLIIGYQADGEFNIITDHIFNVRNFCDTYKDRETHYEQLDVHYSLPEEQTA